MIIKNVLEDLSSNPKVGHTIATLTTATGMGAMFDWIPDDIGNLSALLGAVLSTVLIYTHIIRGRTEQEKARLELKLLEATIAQKKKELEQQK